MITITNNKRVILEFMTSTKLLQHIRISTASHARIRIRYYKSRENPYQVLQVTCAASEHAMGSYDKIIITIVPSCTGENITRLLPLALLLVLHTRNNTDGNKLVIFSGIALYYGDNYILLYTKYCYMLFSRKHQQTLLTCMLVTVTHALARVDHCKYLGSQQAF